MGEEGGRAMSDFLRDIHGTEIREAVELKDREIAAFIRRFGDECSPEVAHIVADGVLLGIVSGMGFAETARAFEELERWYS